MRDDIAIVQLLKALHGQADESDDNSYDNTIIQFFESPHDAATLTAYFQTFIGGAALSSAPNETATFTATLSAMAADPSTFTYGGYGDTPASFANSTPSANQTPTDMANTLFSAGWYWGYGGLWK